MRHRAPSRTPRRGHATRPNVARSQGKTLEALERKMRTHETNIFFLKEFVETKGREIDFQSLRSECAAMVNDLNESLKQRGEAGGFGAAF